MVVSEQMWLFRREVRAFVDMDLNAAPPTHYTATPSTPLFAQEPVAAGLSGDVVLGHDGRLLRASRTARQIAARADALLIDANGLRAIRASDQQRLQLALSRARQTPGSVQALNLPRRSGAPDYLLQIVATLTQRMARVNVGAVLMVIVDPECSKVVSSAVLTQLFELTPAQINLAQRLARGERKAMAARSMGVKLATARTYLTQIYRKTGTQSLAQLVRLLTLLAASGELAASRAGLDGDEPDDMF